MEPSKSDSRPSRSDLATCSIPRHCPDKSRMNTENNRVIGGKIDEVKRYLEEISRRNWLPWQSVASAEEQTGLASSQRIRRTNSVRTRYSSEHRHPRIFVHNSPIPPALTENCELEFDKRKFVRISSARSRIWLKIREIRCSRAGSNQNGFASFTEKSVGLDGIFSSDSRIGSEKSERIA